MLTQHLVVGGGWLLLAGAVSDLGLKDYLFIWTAFSLAGGLGMIAFFTPAGLGIRESVLLPVLAMRMSLEAALALVVLVRLWEIAIDGAFFGLSYLWSSFSPKEKQAIDD